MHIPVLIIGSGVAGLSAAYRLAQKGVDCVVVTKDAEPMQGTNSVYAQGGIVYRSPEDCPEDLVEDVWAAGDQIGSREAIRQLATEGVDLVKEIFIDQLQVPFDREEGKLSFTKEAAHNRARIIHVKDHTGKALMEALHQSTKGYSRVKFLTSHVLVDLLTSGHNCRGYQFKYWRNRCLGAYLFNKQTAQVETVLADHTILCTGGIGQIYKSHTNGAHAYGSGLAAANRARVRIINSRFVQFHPTAFWSTKPGRHFLISEVLRGEGARLMNIRGEYLMKQYPTQDLESRAVISRVIVEEMQRSGHDHVLLNLSDHYTGTIPIPERFPSIYAECLAEGIDISREAIPVVPVAHFFCGGIYVDLNARTELDGLYAAGEVACSGIHGANRLASTSLLEALTWGVKAADDVIDRSVPTDVNYEQAFDLIDNWKSFGDQKADPVEIEWEKDKIRALMWEKVGIIRTKESLLAAREVLRNLWRSIEKKYDQYVLTEDLIELRHLAETAYIITNSASSHTSLMEDNLGGHVLR